MSKYMSRSQAINIGEAVAYAAHIGKPLSRAITINLSTAKVQVRPQEFIGDFLSHASDWLATVGHKPAYYAWALEKIGGWNVHILLHLPKECRKRFGQLQRKWIKAAGGKFLRGVIRSSTAWYPGAPGYWYPGDDEEHDPLKCGSFFALYMLKGTEPAACEELGIEHVDQGEIEGKRCGTSVSLGSFKRFLSGPPLPPLIVNERLGPRRVPHLVFDFQPMKPRQRAEYATEGKEWAPRLAAIRRRRKRRIAAHRA